MKLITAGVAEGLWIHMKVNFKGVSCISHVKELGEVPREHTEVRITLV